MAARGAVDASRYLRGIARAGRDGGYRPRMVHRQGARSFGWFAVVLVATLAVTLVGAVADAATSGKRPDGRWTLVNWEVSRDPADPQFVPGTAGVSVVAFSPRCRSGPCAVRVRPAGIRGTYLPTGAPVTKDSVRSGFRLTWDRTGGVYTAHRDFGRESCIVSDGAGGTKEVAAGYTETSDSTYRLRPGRAGAAASITGTRVTTLTGTPTGAPQGCTDVRISADIAGAPVGSVKTTARGAAGQYRITETVVRTEGSGQRPRGFTGILVPDSAVTANGRGLTITGIVGTAKLRATRAGWSGRVKATQPSCVATSTDPGYETTETWTGLRPVARTEAGEPVLAGTWRYVANPTASGLRDGCSLVTNLGYVVLVPTAAIAP